MPTMNKPKKIANHFIIKIETPYGVSFVLSYAFASRFAFNHS